MPSRGSWSWNATVREVPPLVAAVAAILSGLVAAAFGQSAGQSLAMALLVGIGTFLSVFVWRYIRAPAEIARDRDRRLANWRSRYAIGVQRYPATPHEVDIRVTADRGPDFDGLWCQVEHDGRRVEARTAVPKGPGIEFGGGGQWVTWWSYPTAFGVHNLEPGHYRAAIFMHDHKEPVGEVEWDLPPAQS
jgi:hypothetical protein